MSKNTAFDPRKMMELAINVMRQSIPEGREDGQTSPKVGAVIVRPDGSYETAARGELRRGNHAEFTLIERKCFNMSLDGCILFATLEPCLNRNQPKRGCARHIVDARIKTVYVGVEDDNPSVAGKGIEFLRQHGIEIHMFDSDLQKVILKENETFFDWARQQITIPEEKPVKLSTLEDAIFAVEVGDLSPKALSFYRSRVNFKVTPKKEFDAILLKQGIMVENNGNIVPSGFGLILFGKKPGQTLHQSRFLAKAELPNGVSRMEFDQPLVFMPEALEVWLKSVLPSTLDRSQMERQEQVDLPFEIIREAVVNALIHRDYSITEQKCQLIVNADTITIKSPGGPVYPITIEELNTFSAPMKSRNPLLHYVFNKLKLAEEQGFGLTSLKMRAEKMGLPLPKYTMQGDYLVLTIYRTVESATRSLSEAILTQLSAEERKGWDFLTGRNRITQSEYTSEMKVTARTAQRHLTHFVKLGMLRRVGRGPSTEYIKE